MGDATTLGWPTILRLATELDRARIKRLRAYNHADGQSSCIAAPNWSAFPPEPLVPRFRIHSVAIFVANMDRSLRFYVDQLGFKLIAEIHISIGRCVAVAPPDGTTMLVLVTPEPDSQEYKLTGRSRHVVLVAEDVVANFQEWSKRGVRFRSPPQAQIWGGMETNLYPSAATG